MKKLVLSGLVAAIAFLMSGCANKVPTYSNTVQNMRAVKVVAASASPVNIGTFTATNEGESKVMCRLATPVGTPDGVTFAKYIEDALSVELEMGNMIDPKSKVTITGNLENIYGSTILGNAYWEFKLKVTSSNGKNIDEALKYLVVNYN